MDKVAKQNMIMSIVNGNQTDENIAFVNSFLNLTEDEKKRVVRKLKDEVKNARNGRARSFFLAEFIETSKVFEFVQLLNLHFYSMFEKEKARAWAYMNDVEEAEKYGFVKEGDFKEGGKYWDSENNRPSKKMPKQTDDMLEKWTSKAYPNIAEALWEAEAEFAFVKLATVTEKKD